MKKAQLSADWKIRVSKTHPEKVFYYNVKTGAKSWNLPESGENDKKKDKPKANSGTKEMNDIQSRGRVDKKKTSMKVYQKHMENNNMNFKGIPSSVKQFYQDKVVQKKTKGEPTKVTQIISNDNSKTENFANESKSKFQPAITPAMRLSMLQKKSSEDSQSTKDQQKDENRKRVSKITPVSKDNKLRSVNETGKLKKNIASSRMKNLKQKLNLEIAKEKEESARSRRPLQSNEVVNFTESAQPVKHQWGAPARLRDVQKILEQNRGCLKKFRNDTELVNSDLPVVKVVEDCCSSLVEEEMDWQPIEDEKILIEVSEVRQMVYSSENAEYNLPQNKFQISSMKGDSNLYIVVDTNVFLIDLDRVKEMMDTKFKQYGRPFIIIPWTVIQELDAIKDSKSKQDNLRNKARKAISFLHNHFSNKHPRVLGQTAEDAYSNKALYDSDNPDDMIWQTCLQIKRSHPNVVLLTFDKNLQNKALINNIKVLGRDNDLEMIDSIVNEMNTSAANHFLCGNEKKETITSNVMQKKALLVDDVFTKIQDMVYVLMTEILSSEAKNLFGNNWINHMKIKPPWTSVTLLKCAELHWIAITSEAFANRRAESTIKRLQEYFRKHAGELKIKDILLILDIMIELVDMLNPNIYKNVQKRMSEQVDQIRCRVIEEEQELGELELEEQIGRVYSHLEIKERADLGLKVFTHVYTYCMNVTGSFLVRFNFVFPFEFTILNYGKSFFTRENQTLMQSQVKTLLHHLKLALDDFTYQRTNYSNIIKLYDSLTAMDTGFDGTVTPLDIYCCLQQNKAQLTIGVCQFEDILTHFSKLSDCNFE